MKDWRQALIFANTTIIDAMRAIDRAAIQLAIVINQDKTIHGTVTDGDIRRGLLDGHQLADPVSEVVNTTPTTVKQDQGRETALALMKQLGFRHLPVLNEANCVIDIWTLEDLINATRRPNPVLLLAGGLGTRLGPLTQNLPKPMLNVGRKPILQSIMESFIRLGFYRFYLSVNYKAEMIESYFGDGSRWDVHVEYLKEDIPLGTAGAVGLMPSTEHDVIVMNGDILTNLNFTELLDHHNQTNAAATMCVREFDFQLPYGVVESESGQLTDLKEKPSQRFDINAGVYCLSPNAIKQIPKNERYDMTTLFEDLKKTHQSLSVFPIRDYWLDIGRLDDFEKAQRDAENILGASGL